MFDLRLPAALCLSLLGLTLSAGSAFAFLAWWVTLQQTGDPLNHRVAHVGRCRSNHEDSFPWIRCPLANRLRSRASLENSKRCCILSGHI